MGCGLWTVGMSAISHCELRTTLRSPQRSTAAVTVTVDVSPFHCCRFLSRTIHSFTHPAALFSCGTSFLNRRLR